MDKYQTISFENDDVLKALEMNGFLVRKEDGLLTGYYIPVDCLDDAITFLRDYYIVLGKR